MKKTLEIIAGPNGSGKSTFAETALKKRKESLYINSDSIARGLTLNGSAYAQYEAGRFMLKQIDDCLKQNLSFSFETTMSGRIWISHIRQAKKHGVELLFLTPPSNVRDIPPGFSAHRPGLAKDELSQWEGYYKRGVELAGRDEPAKALQAFEEAAHVFLIGRFSEDVLGRRSNRPSHLGRKLRCSF